MTRKTFYLHIPKTGGQSLAQRMAALYPLGRSEVLTTDYGENDAEKLREAFDRFDFIESHANGGVLGRLSGAKILVTVRNPIDQIASHYRHLAQPSMPLWERAVKAMEPGAFLDTFADFLTNYQARCIVEAFYNFEGLSREIGPLETILRYLPSCLERIDWFVPSERIDEFLDLWALENDFPVRPRKFVPVNQSQKDSIDTKKLREAIASRSELYDFDTVIYNHARRRYSEFYNRAVSKHTVSAEINDAFLTFRAHGEHIWLAQNWYAPEPKEVTGGEYTWWAGPWSRSSITCRLKEPGGLIKFKVKVFSGVSPLDLVFLDDQFKALKSEFHRSGDDIEFSIDVKHLAGDSKVYIDVPFCYAPIQISKTDDSCVRRSILTANWRVER